MHALGFDGVVVDYGIALLGLFLRSNLLLLDLGDAGPDVGQDEEASSLKYFDRASWPLSVSSTEFIFSSMTK